MIALFLQWEDRLKLQSIVNSQIHRRQFSNIIYYPIYSTFTITSLLLSYDLALYVWIQVDTISIHTSEESRLLGGSDLHVRRASFNPHLPSNQTIHSVQFHLLQNTSLHISSNITLGGDFWTVFVFRKRCNLDTRRRHQYVGTYRCSSSGRMSTGCVLEYDEERKSFSDWLLYLIQWMLY